jgi:hypothetical protein
VPFRQTTVAGFPAIALRSEQIEVVAVPAIGMKLTHLRRLRGREWLWRSDQVPLAVPHPGASYTETAGSGGWDECFPTVGPSPIPGAPAGTLPLPDGGELWSADWTSSVYEHADGTTLTGTAQGTRLRYDFHREVTLLRGAAAVRLRYRLRHTGVAPFPWIWSPHALFNVQPGTTLELPGVRQVKLDAVHGRDDLSRDDVVSWPGAIGGAPGRFALPEAGGWAVKLFGDLGRDGRMVLTDPREGERLEILVDPVAVPQVGVWINLGGWAPEGQMPAYTMALAPCIGAPDRLEDAVLAWGTGQMLAPGEERGWEVVVRLPEPDAESP